MDESITEETALIPGQPADKGRFLGKREKIGMNIIFKNQKNESFFSI